MLELAWRRRANLDRESIAIFIALERQNPQAALETIQKIDKAIEFIREFPDTGGRFTQDGLEHEYRTTLANSYTIFYRYNDITLTIYRILHQRQDIDTFTLVDLEN